MLHRIEQAMYYVLYGYVTGLGMLYIEPRSVTCL